MEFAAIAVAILRSRHWCNVSPEVSPRGTPQIAIIDPVKTASMVDALAVGSQSKPP